MLTGGGPFHLGSPVRIKEFAYCLFAAALGLALGSSVASADTLDLKTTCHASGNGNSDDSRPLKTCLALLEQAITSGHPTALHIPAGIFRISGAAGQMPVLSRGATIQGEGPHATTLKLDADFDGDLFAWDEAWIAGTENGPAIDLARDATGPTLTGLRITGLRAAAHVQNAIVFYDRNDHVLLRDIEIDDLHGDCLRIGAPRHMPEAYMRESTFINLKCFSTGLPGSATVTIGSLARPGSDATNELDIYKLAVFDALGQGVAIRNPATGSATRGVRFYGIRVEKTGAEGLSIGDPRDLGEVAGITAYDLTVIGAGGAALRIASSPVSAQPYSIRISGGSLGPGNTRGIEIDSGRLIDIVLDTVDAPIVLGAHAGADISISSNGVQSTWRFAGTKPGGSEANPLELRSPFSLRGLPGAGDRVGAVAMRADLSGGQTRALTMDGQAPNAYNCFNPGFGQSYSLGLRVLLQDHSHPDRYLNWTLPSATLSAWYGPGSAVVAQAPATVLQKNAPQATVELDADRLNGCLSLRVHAPPPASDHWSATALITYARAP